MAGVGFSLGCVTVLCMRHPDISVLFTFFRVETLLRFEVRPKLYIPSTPNDSNETHTFMCQGRTGRFGQC